MESTPCASATTTRKKSRNTITQKLLRRVLRHRHPHRRRRRLPRRPCHLPRIRPVCRLPRHPCLHPRSRRALRPPRHPRCRRQVHRQSIRSPRLRHRLCSGYHTARRQCARAVRQPHETNATPIHRQRCSSRRRLNSTTTWWGPRTGMHPPQPDALSGFLDANLQFLRIQ